MSEAYTDTSTRFMLFLLWFVMAIFMAVAQHLGVSETFLFYERILYYDKIMHFMGGYTCSMFVMAFLFWIVCLSKCSNSAIVSLALLYALLASVVWEVLQNGNLVPHFTQNPNLEDTLGDIGFGVLGGFSVAVNLLVLKQYSGISSSPV
jgi:hypothetical protein